MVRGHVEVTVAVEVADGGVPGLDRVERGAGRHDLAAGQPRLPAPDGGQGARLPYGPDGLLGRADDQVRVPVTVQVSEGQAPAEPVAALGGARYAGRVLADELPVPGVKPFEEPYTTLTYPAPAYPAPLDPPILPKGAATARSAYPSPLKSARTLVAPALSVPAACALTGPTTAPATATATARPRREPNLRLLMGNPTPAVKEQPSGGGAKILTPPPVRLP